MAINVLSVSMTDWFQSMAKGWDKGKTIHFRGLVSINEIKLHICVENIKDEKVGLRKIIRLNEYLFS